MQTSQDKSRVRWYFSLLANRFERWYWPKIQPPISWIFWKYLHDERGHNRFTNGLREFCWVVMCGHGVGYGLRVANIWWKLSFFPQCAQPNTNPLSTNKEPMKKDKERTSKGG